MDVNEDEDSSVAMSISNSDETPMPSEEERDEVKELQKMSAKDTRKVQLWRLAVTGVLLLTACAVTYTTYRFLKNEEKYNFEVAFEQFSRTVADAAVAKQINVRNAFATFAAVVTEMVAQTNQTWPYVTVPGFEAMAKNARDQGHFEILVLNPIVQQEDRTAYVNYATSTYQDWVVEGHLLQKGSLERLTSLKDSYLPYISKYDPDGFIPDDERDYYIPSWQYSPPPSTCGLINWNLRSIPDYDFVNQAAIALRNETVVTKVRPYVSVPTAMSQEEHDAMHSMRENSDSNHPHSFVFHPVSKELNNYSSEIVGIIGSAIAWDEALRELLPDGVSGIHAIIKNDCNQSYTYEIDGRDAFYEGEGDMHEAKYEEMAVHVNLALHTHPNFTKTPGHCQFTLDIYPTSKFEASYDSNTPEVYAGVVAVTFAIVALVFFVYDIFVQQRNNNLIAQAAQTSALVTSLFPDNIRDQLIAQNEEAKAAKKGNLKTFMNDSQHKEKEKFLASKPLADLFLETTVLYADISGFTAWSSVREPSQVFTLLEHCYSSFDRIAKKRRVFKVETTGDCYVAVAGIPDPRADHFLAMARFARDIISRFVVLVKDLEVVLGPDTGDLGLRVGIHSGPVTGGVLRGERSRFQLFGDTVNTCSHIEATGKVGRIHASKETAELLKKAGKDGWLVKREDAVTVKGKGTLETYWLNVMGGRQGSVASGGPSDGGGEAANMKTVYGKDVEGLDAKLNRLVNWNVELLAGLLKKVIANREVSRKSEKRISSVSLVDSSARKTPLEEVREIIHLPEYNEKAFRKQKDPEEIELPSNVTEQLHHLVGNIARMYRDNPFHNFEHASHVVMAVTKVMSRIVAPSHLEDELCDEKKKKKVAATLHDHTYGITSDPLTHFACAFSALIHDVDHSGVSNAQLVKEGDSLCATYGDRSVAEQNSLDLSWDLLMTPKYNDLRALLFNTDADCERFRQLVVNSVMATDIVDKDLKALRNARWDKAFKKGESQDFVESPKDEVNRKATIVIEHIIQASDISHTMQHWHVYRKWNQNLFEELYVAYLQGRMDKDPAEFWAKGEIGFFDFYIIPLTRKLKDCGVFGVSSDEYLNYAMKNREEWSIRGEEVVKELIAEARRKYGAKKEDAATDGDCTASASSNDSS